MKLFLNLIYFLLSLFLTSCSFQTSFFKQINKEFINKNLIISPLSAYQVLGLTANGAKGKTLEQMLLALGNKNLNELNKINLDILKVSKKFTTVEIANAVMTKFKPEKSFLNSVSKYEATVEILKNASQVNKWCSIKTRGKIKEIIKNLNPLTKMILLNAVYFKGEWLDVFNERNTIKKPFYNLNDQSKVVQIDKMIKTDYSNYYDDNEIQMVELPYKKDSMSAIIILPKEKININNYISNLNDEKLQQIFKRMRNVKVHLELPKFELEFSSSLKSTLQKLGMDQPFNKSTADFSEMRKEKDIYIDEVIQKTYLKVDEWGTEAAAAANELLIASAGPDEAEKIEIIIINRPFLFLLRNEKLPKNYEMMFMAKIETLK